MNMEIRAEAALFPEKEYISGIFVAVQDTFIALLNSVVDPDPIGSRIFGMLRYGSGTFFVSTTFYYKRYRRKHAMKIIALVEGAEWK